jgi:hypothetical protein
MDEALHVEGDTAFTGDGIISIFAASSRVRGCADGRDVRRDLFWSVPRSSDLKSIASNVPARAVSALPMVVRARPFSTAGAQKRPLTDGMRARDAWSDQANGA